MLKIANCLSSDHYTTFLVSRLASVLRFDRIQSPLFLGTLLHQLTETSGPGIDASPANYTQHTIGNLPVSILLGPGAVFKPDGREFHNRSSQLESMAQCAVREISLSKANLPMS